MVPLKFITSIRIAHSIARNLLPFITQLSLLYIFPNNCPIELDTVGPARLLF